MELDETFDWHAWQKKAYRPDIIIIVPARDLPNEWVLIDGVFLAPLLIIPLPISNMPILNPNLSKS